MKSFSKFKRVIPALLLSSTALPLTGVAQDAPFEPPVAASDDNTDETEVVGSNATDTTADGQEIEEIVVTGTLIRGMDKPIGTNVVSVDEEAIAASGASSANELMRNIPQVSSSFLSNPTVDGGGVSVIRPNLRDLGGSGGSTTLILLDGHRMVPAGVVQTTPDPDVIPPAVLERVEIVPDGGSSTYGSDAVGGVINFITRKRFDGFEAAGRYGFADNYRKLDLNITGGKAWDSGSGYVSYAHSRNDALLGRDRDFMRQVDPQRGFCPPGTVRVPTGETYAIENGAPGSTAGTMSTCDNTDGVSFWPASERNTVFAVLNQEINSFLTFDTRAYYSRRELEQFGNSAGGQQTWTVTDQNPYFQPVGSETTQTILTEFGGLYSNSSTNELDEYGITPSLTADFGNGWQLRLLGNFGASNLQTQAVAIDSAALTAALAGTTTATALNPYNPGASNPAVLAGIARSSHTDVEQKLNNGRAIVDGPIFELPGGDVRVAAGAEYIQETYRGVNGTAIFGQEKALPVTSLDRNIVAMFGEVAVPIVGASNARPGIQQLTLSASARRDDYSDVGSTFNPKLGMTYKPIDSVNIRGNWGESFNAPSLVDVSGNQQQGWIPAQSIPGQTAPFSLLIIGNDGTNKPQTAKTWSLGIDVEPTSIPNLVASLTYYNIEIENLFGIVNPALGLNSSTAPYLRDGLTCADALAEIAGVDQSPSLPSVAAVCASPLGAVARFSLADLRLRNLGPFKQDGLDFNVAYSRDLGFGVMNTNIGGTYTLNREIALTPGAPFVNRLETPGVSRLFVAASAGLQVGSISGSASLKHRAGYDLNPAVAPTVPAGTATPFPPQNHVASFTTLDAFLSYDASAWLKGTILTLNVDNLFDRDPPFFNSCSTSRFPCGYANGSTLGRMVTLGIRATF